MHACLYGYYDNHFLKMGWKQSYKMNMYPKCWIHYTDAALYVYVYDTVCYLVQLKLTEISDLVSCITVTYFCKVSMWFFLWCSLREQIPLLGTDTQKEDMQGYRHRFRFIQQTGGWTTSGSKEENPNMGSLLVKWHQREIALCPNVTLK